MIYDLEWMIPGVGLITLSATFSGEDECNEIEYFSFEHESITNPELIPYVEEYIEHNEIEIAECLVDINTAIGVCVTFNL